MNEQYNATTTETVRRAKLIAIVGLTYEQGDSVATKFLSLPDWKVRAVTDEETDDKVRELAIWASRGVEIERADFTDPSRLVMAFVGADVIFSVTDYMALLNDQSTRTLASLWKTKTVFEIAQQHEMMRNRRIFQAAAMVPTLERFVMSLDPSPVAQSEGHITQAYHMEGKWAATKAMAQQFPTLNKKTTFLQVGWLMRRYRQHMTRDGQGGLVLLGGCGGDVRIPWVHQDDIGNYVHAIVDRLPPGLQIACFSQMLSWNELSRLITQLSGVPVPYRQITRPQLHQMRPQDTSAQLSHIEQEYLAKYPYYGRQNVLASTQIAELFGVRIRTRTFEDFLHPDILDITREFKPPATAPSSHPPSVQDGVTNRPPTPDEPFKTPPENAAVNDGDDEHA